MATIIIDFQHLVYKTLNPNVPYLSVSKEVAPGQFKTICTTIPSMTIKSVWNYSGRGELSCAVCLEGGASSREDYFSNLGQDYKSGRKKLNSQMKEGINIAVDLMHRGGVSCYRKAGFESDDFVYTLVHALKKKGYTDPIYVVTNDHDMLPLVDEQVSVYMKAPRTYRVGSAPELTGYFQVTPDTWSDFVEYSSRYGKAGTHGFNVPYNSVLLYKLLRGDDSDNIKGIKGFGAVKFNKVIDAMTEAGVNFSETFRYTKTWEEIEEVVKPFFNEKELAQMKDIYGGIQLKYTMPLDEVNSPKIIDYGKLQQTLLEYSINIVET